MRSPSLSDLTPTIAWVDGAIEIIDQRRLPERLEVRRLTTLQQVVEAISTLAVRGAPALGGAGALGVVLGIDGGHDPSAAARIVGEARPTAVNLAWAAGRVRDVALDGGRDAALAEALAVIEEDRAACEAIGRHGRELLVGVERLMTHCNAGRLATCGIGTALAPIYVKAFAGEPVHVLAPETRPLLQGARLTAWELADAGIDVRVTTDSAAAGALLAGEVDAVIVGADRIAANGDVANKVGTLAHALAADRAGVPFYVAAPRSTFDPATPTGAAIPIEQRSAAEVGAPDGVAVWNPAFDVTPAELITAFITDVGVLRPPYAEAIAAL